MLPIELTNVDIKNSAAYKEYYAVATGATPPKPKASVRKTRSSSNTTVTPLTAAAGLRLSTSAKGKQPATTYRAKSLSALSKEHEGDDDEDDQKEGSDDEQAFDEEEFIHLSLSTHAEEETKDEESFDPIPKHLKTLMMKAMLKRILKQMLEGGIQTTQEFEDSHVTLTPVNPDGQQQSSSMSSQFVTSMLNSTPDARMESIFEMTSYMDVQTPISVAPLPMSAPTLTPSTIATITTTQQAPIPPRTASSTLLQDLPNFGSLFGLDNRLNKLEANFSEFMQTNQFAGASNKLHDDAQAENDEFLKTIDENMQKIIKEQVKEQVKTSYAVAADLSEMELKKILIEKMEGNKSIQRSNEQRNHYKALVEAHKSDKIFLDTYGDTVTEGKEPESASAPKKKATRSASKSTQGSKSRQTSASESATTEEPMQTTFEMEELSHPEFEIAGPTYELMKGSCKSLVELEFFLEEVYKATTDQLDWVNPEGQQYPHNLLKLLPLIPNSRGRHVIPFDHFINNDLEYLCGGASSRKYTTSVTKTKATDYGLLVLWFCCQPGITVRRDDDRLYKFKEGDFKRLHIQDIEDMLLLLIQGKLINLTVKERFAFNVSLRMFTRSIVIQRHVEDLQLGVESYQKKLNLTRPDTYRSDLKRKEAYSAYSNPRGFIYHNKDKKNRLMRIDKLHKSAMGRSPMFALL
nr:hypothetical protein [Tanacetum cinerariifolium]